MDPTDPRTAHVGWTSDAGGQVLLDLQVQTINAEGLSYGLEARVHFGSDDVAWSASPEEADPLELLLLGVALPEEAYFSEGQTLYTSDLLVQVVVVDTATGAELRRVPAAPLRLVWPEGGDVLAMDLDAAEQLAPSGVYDEHTRDALAHDSDGNVNVEYGYHD